MLDIIMKLMKLDGKIMNLELQIVKQDLIITELQMQLLEERWNFLQPKK